MSKMVYILVLAFCAVLLSSSTAFAQSLSGGTGGNGGTTGPPNSGNGGNSVDTYDLNINRSGMNVGRYPASGIDSCGIIKTKSGKQYIPNRGGTAQDNLLKCAARIAGVMGGVGKIENGKMTGVVGDTSVLDSQCDNSQLTFCLNKVFKSNLYSYGELHGFKPYKNGQNPYSFLERSTAVTSYSLYVWKVNLKNPRATSSQPYFQRSLTAYQNPNLQEGWTDLGRVKDSLKTGPVSQQKCYGLGGILNCQSDEDYYKGGARGRGAFFTAKGNVKKAGAFYKRDGACGNDWSGATGGRAKLAAVRGVNRLNNAITMGGYVAGAGGTFAGLAEYAGLAGADTACFYKLGPSAKHYYVEQDGTTTTSGGNVEESIAVAYSLDKGLSYNLKGIPGNIYIVSVYAITPNENIFSSNTRAIVPPAPLSSLINCNIVDCPDPVGEDPIENGGGPGGIPGEDDDDNPFSGEGTFLDGHVYPLPTIKMLLDAPDSVSTGSSAQWKTTIEGENGPPQSEGAVLWLREIGFRMVDPQVKTVGWTNTVNNQKFYVDGDVTQGAFYIGRPQGQGIHSKSINQIAPAYWGLQDLDNIMFSARSYLRQTNPFTLASAQEENYVTNTLIPNQSERDPQVGESYLIYEAGRFINYPSRANCQNVTRQMRSNNPGVQSEYPVLTTGSTIAQGFMFHQQKDASTGTSVCPRSDYTVDITFVGSSPNVNNIRISDSDTYGQMVDFRLSDLGMTGSYVSGNTYRFTIPASANMPTGGYLVTAELNGVSVNTPFTMSVTGVMDSRDEMQWAGRSYQFGPFNLMLGTDNDPYFGGVAENADCGSGVCVLYSNLEEMHTLGNQPG